MSSIKQTNLNRIARILTDTPKPQHKRKQLDTFTYEQLIQQLDKHSATLRHDLPTTAHVLDQARAKLAQLHYIMTQLAEFNNTTGNFGLNHGDGYTLFHSPYTVELTRKTLQEL